MPRIAVIFFRTAAVCFVIGVLVGMQMGISGDHSLIQSHAHTNLLGWVSSALFGAFYALNPAAAALRWAVVHYVTYTAGLVLMMPGLYFSQLGVEGLEPAVAIGASLICLGVLIFSGVVFTATRKPRT
jgi:cbb3-type cytochrome oxidase subunit 1